MIVDARKNILIKPKTFIAFEELKDKFKSFEIPEVGNLPIYRRYKNINLCNKYPI